MLVDGKKLQAMVLDQRSASTNQRSKDVDDKKAEHIDKVYLLA